MVSIPVLVLVSLGTGILLQWGVLRLVNRRELLAEVNERSSHTIPTPTMGGVVIVVVALAFLGWVQTELGALVGGLMAASALVAAVGLWDDLKNLNAKIRFAVQIVAAAIGLWALGVPVSGHAALLLIALVWFTNLYNFMDGIDGYAAIQALVFCLGLHLVTGGVPGWSGYLLWTLSGVTLSFLAYNWPPARIFIGDVGSGFLGLLIGLLALYLWQVNLASLLVSLILLAGFWVDASYTLCVRIITGQRFTEAHRSHLYQRLATRYGHTWTTCAFMLFASIWLMPLAWFAHHFVEFQIYCLVAATLPLLAACGWSGAGVKDI